MQECNTLTYANEKFWKNCLPWVIFLVVLKPWVLTWVYLQTQAFNIISTEKYYILDLFLHFSSYCHLKYVEIPEAATRGVLCKKMFLEISQNSQENICARASILIPLVIFKPLSYCFEETIGFDVKASFESRPVPQCRV